jgi:hypothetical protein
LREEKGERKHVSMKDPQQQNLERRKEAREHERPITTKFRKEKGDCHC